MLKIVRLLLEIKESSGALMNPREKSRHKHFSKVRKRAQRFMRAKVKLL